MLYDGVKYLHRAYNYKELKIETLDPMNFVVHIGGFMSDHLTWFYTILDDYMGYRYQEIKSGKKVSSIATKAPMDILYNQEDLGKCPEKQVCFWIMRYICDVCQVLRNHNLIKVNNFEELPILEELDHITYEDFYYYTLAVLYNAFIVRDGLIKP